MSDTTNIIEDEDCGKCQGSGIVDIDCAPCDSTGEVYVTYNTMITYHYADGTEDEYEDESRDGSETCDCCGGDGIDNAECGECEGSGLAA